MGKPQAMPEAQWQEQKRRNAMASQEGRAVYVRGIPPEWTAEQLTDFFGFQGSVEGVNLLPPRPGQPGRAAFVNFTTCEEAQNAAQVCDNLPVDDSTEGNFRLSCSIKKDVGQKVEFVSGFSDMSKARQEGRSVYLSGLAPGTTEEQVRDLLEPHGLVEHIAMLPPGAGKMALSCFAIMGSPAETAGAIEGLNGQEVDGHTLVADYPRPPKRTRDGNEEEPPELENAGHMGGPATLDIRGFPFETSPADITAAIEAGGRSVQSVRVLPLGPVGREGIIAQVRMQSLADAKAVVEELNNFEFMPRCFLQVTVRQEVEARVPQRVPPRVPPPPAQPAQPAVGQGRGGPRRRGGVVGKLAYDRSAYTAEELEDNGSADAATKPGAGARPSAAPHLQPRPSARGDGG